MYSRTVCSQSVDHNQKVGHCKVFDGCGVRSEITTSGSEKKDGTIKNSTTNLMLKVWLREVKISSFFFTHTHTAKRNLRMHRVKKQLAINGAKTANCGWTLQSSNHILSRSNAKPRPRQTSIFFWSLSNDKEVFVMSDEMQSLRNVNFTRRYGSLDLLLFLSLGFFYWTKNSNPYLETYSANLFCSHVKIN